MLAITFKKNKKSSLLFLLPSFTGTNRKVKSVDFGPNVDQGSSGDCLPCQKGCAYCKDDAPCVVGEDGVLRLAVLSFQCLCVLIVFISMVVIYHFRRNKVKALEQTCSIWNL